MNLKLWLPKWSGHKMAWLRKDTISKYDSAADGPEVDIIRLLTGRSQTYYNAKIRQTKITRGY